MSQLVERQKFYDNGNPKRNKENFQGFLFDGLDQTLSITPISFYRSDFRGAKIQNCRFSKNDFSRADFIDSMIEKSSFDECLFRYSEFHNCFFDQSVIRNTHFRSASFNRLFFNECNIEKGRLQDITVRDCSFRQCKVSGTEFVQNSLDEVKFEECNLSDIDLSNMTAINIFFTNCTFSNLTIEADYLGSYFFKGTYLDEVKLKYRGRLFKLNLKKQELLGNLFKIFLENKRYYEAINIFIQKNLLLNEKSSIQEITRFAITELLLEKNFLTRSYQLEKIFLLYEFYFNSIYIPIDDYFNVIAFTEQLDTSHLSLQDQMTVLNAVQKLKNLFHVAELTSEFISSSNQGTALLEITVADSNEKEFIPAFENIIHQLVDRGEGIRDVYEIIGKRKGSVIFEIVIHAMIGLAVLKALKAGLKQIRGISNEVAQIAIDFSVNRKLMIEAKKAKTIEKLQRVKRTQVLAGQAIDNPTKNETIKAEELLSIVESARYFPNALTKST